jgi:Mn-containing catalase
MYYHDSRLQYPVRVERPNPLFARMLQQAIGGPWGSRGPVKYRDMLLETGTEEIGHIEMLATAVALNLEGAPISLQEEAARSSPAVEAVLGGMNLRHILSTGLAATPENANGVPFNASHVYASGNIAADMYANVMAEATGRTLATRLWEATDDPGMKDMLSFLIARDTMHQNQWLAVIEELGGHEKVLPIPNSFPQSEEHADFSYAFMSTMRTAEDAPPAGRWTAGRSIDGKGEFSIIGPFEPLGQVPQLGAPDPRGHAQMEQMGGAGIVERARRMVKGE